jgi:hypothetical protein
VDGSELEEGERDSVEILPVLGRTPATVEPGDGAFDDSALRERDKAFDPIRAFDDFGFETRQDAGQGGVKDRPLVGAVGEQLLEIGDQAEHRRQQNQAAIAILNIGGDDDAAQEQALGIDENVPLLALDQLARIKAGRIDARSPFFGALHALAVDDAGRGAGFPVRPLAALDVELVMDPIKRAIQFHRPR